MMGDDDDDDDDTVFVSELFKQSFKGGFKEAETPPPPIFGN